MPDPVNQEPQNVGRPPPGNLLRLALASAAGLLVVGAIGLYGMRPSSRKPGTVATTSTACAKSLNAAMAIAPLAKGDVAALTPSTAPIDLSAVAFDDADGHKTTVGGFKGKTILLNLWATWCVPCRAEMPALDKLQSANVATNFSVVPVNVDTTRLEKPPAFLKEIGATHLPFYSDKSADILQVLKQAGGIEGLPTSILIGTDGCAIGVMAGPAVWDSPDAKALVTKASS